jgi:hypothetical protein
MASIQLFAFFAVVYQLKIPDMKDLRQYSKKCAECCRDSFWSSI